MIKVKYVSTEIVSARNPLISERFGAKGFIDSIAKYKAFTDSGNMLFSVVIFLRIRMPTKVKGRIILRSSESESITIGVGVFDKMSDVMVCRIVAKMGSNDAYSATL